MCSLVPHLMCNFWGMLAVRHAYASWSVASVLRLSHFCAPCCFTEECSFLEQRVERVLCVLAFKPSRWGSTDNDNVNAYVYVRAQVPKRLTN